MGDSVLAIDLFLHYTVLVNTDCGENVKHGLVHRLKTVDNERNSNLLPTRGSLFCMSSPILGLLCFANITNIQHNAMESSGIESLVLVIGGDGYEQLGVTIVHFRTQGPSACLGEFIRVNGSRSVPHMAKQIH